MNRAYKLLGVALLGVVGALVLASTMVSGAPPRIGSERSTPTATPQLRAAPPALDPDFQKATAVIQEREDHFATQRALPPTAREAQTPDPLIYGTPVPADYRPPWVDVAKPLTKAEIGGVPTFRDATSIWQNGGVANRSETDWFPLILYAVGDEGEQPVVAVYIPNTEEIIIDLPRSWQAPKVIGALTITAIRGGPLGILSFESSSGTTGTLNMATGEWTFD